MFQRIVGKQSIFFFFYLIKQILRCFVCDTCNGACIKCTHPDCNISFHVSCAQRSGLTLQIEQNREAKNGVNMISLCLTHSIKNEIKNNQLNREKRNNSSTTNFDVNNYIIYIYFF